MNFLITGATGFIGRHLTDQLTLKGHQIYALTRSPNKYEDKDQVTYLSYDVNPKELPTIHGVINLAGESLFGYWTNAKQKEIRYSRIEVTRHIVRLVQQLKERPKVFINGSAVGYYGTSTEMIFTEQTIETGDDFLSSVVVDWENEAKQIESTGIRTIYARFGIVLGKNEGSLPLMELPIKLFVGGKIGDGEQWISWVHMEDAARLLSFCLFEETIKGPVNITAPAPKRNKDFYQTLARVYKRPLWLPVPRLFMRIALGEMSELITKGQFVYPKKAIDCGFTFHYPKLPEALASLR